MKLGKSWRRNLWYFTLCGSVLQTETSEAWVLEDKLVVELLVLEYQLLIAQLPSLAGETGTY